MRAILIATILVATGCAGQQKTAGLGVMTDGDALVLQGHFAQYEEGRVGWWGSLAAGGQEPRGDEFGKDTGPFVPGPESSLSSRTGTTSLAAGAQGGITYRHDERWGAFAGVSIWGEEVYDEYKYSTPFSGAGRYYVDDGDLEVRVGAVLGLELFFEGGTLGLHFDTAVEMLGLSIGMEF